jgi:flagellar motor protein MotB
MASPSPDPPQSDLHFDYEKTTEVFKLLADIRFKLLAFVPTIVGVAIALMGDNKPPGVMVGVGALGLCGTIGVLLYELRNSELYNQAIHRAKYLEGLQRFPISVASTGRWPENGGVFSERHRGGYDFLGFIPIKHDVGLGFVYSAAVSGWVFLIVRGLTAALLLSTPAAYALTLGFALAAGLLTWSEVFLHDHYQFKPVPPNGEYDPPTAPRWRRGGFILCAGLLIAASLALAWLEEVQTAPAVTSSQESPLSNQSPGAISPGISTVPTEEVQTAPTAALSSEPHVPTELIQVRGYLWAAIIVSGLSALAGIVLAAFRKDRRVVGSAVAVVGVTAASLLGAAHLKLDNLLKMENRFEINPSVQAALNRVGARAPIKIGDVRGFASGRAEITDSMSGNFFEVCKSWNEHAKDGGLLMLIGSTDRAQLIPQALQRYGSNAGLARARAETARNKIHQQCGVPLQQMFTEITGPAYTPELNQGAPPSKGYPDDRHVEVWAFWNASTSWFEFKMGDKHKEHDDERH